jgi:signal transduction histidine kinase
MEVLINQIVPMITFPVIITDAKDEPSLPYEYYTLNIKLDSSLKPSQQLIQLKQMIQKMKGEYEPRIIKDKGLVIAKFYFSHSPLIDRLKIFPLLEIFIIAVFILIGYIAFSNIRRSEESKVWVGMAKEAAHQLGTPLSSLLAWIEILKFNDNDPKSFNDTLEEMENDINRLNMIATRFSKIGSQPELHKENLNELIENVCGYFEKRLPHLGRKVEIVRTYSTNIITKINPELFAWVIENLIKNSAEAIENKNGKIKIDVIKTKSKIIINFNDNGKGMSLQQRRQAFYPGFTTKKRGWGLGLSLCKRIVVEYHKGKIYIKDTSPSKGTTFTVELPHKNIS